MPMRSGSEIDQLESEKHEQRYSTFGADEMAGDLHFEWDRRKAESNKRKHGIRFETAVLFFDDPRVLEIDEGNTYGEAQALGELLFVCYASFEEEGDEIVRIISARKAEAKEHRAYQRHSENYRRHAPRD